MNKKYWKIWGLRFAGINFLGQIIVPILGISISSAFNISYTSSYWSYYYFINGIFNFPAIILGKSKYIIDIGVSPLVLLLGVLLSILVYFVIGAVIGLIYDKIKVKTIQ